MERTQHGKVIPWRKVFAGYPVYYNYKTNVQDLSIQGVFTINNIRFHKAKTKMVFYGFGGLGGTIYETKVNALDQNGAKYNFSGISGSVYKDRKDTRKALKDLLDDTYETDAQSQDDRAKLFGKTFRPSGTIGAGMAFKLGKKDRWSLALEDRLTIVKDDLLDGQQWTEHAGDDAVLTRDFDSYNFLSLGLNYAIGKSCRTPLVDQSSGLYLLRSSEPETHEHSETSIT